MTLTDRTSENCSHDRIRLLLPWYVSHSLDAGEREQVRTHLRHCSQCLEEVRRLAVFARGIAQLPTPPLAHADSFARLKDKIRARQAASQSKTHRPSWLDRIGQAFLPRQAWIPAGLALALLLLILPLGVWQWQVGTEPRFRTLADSGQTVQREGDLRIVFADTLGTQQIDALLGNIHGTRLAGPDASGVYTVRLAEGASAIAPAIARLRGQPDVLFVEPIHGP